MLLAFILGIGQMWGAINNTTVTKTGGSQKYLDVATTAASEGDEVTVSEQYIAYTVNELVSSAIKGVWYTQSSSGSGSSNTDAVSITGYRSTCSKYIGISSSKKYTHYVTNCVSFSALYDPRGGSRYCTITATNMDDEEDIVTITNSGTVSSGTKYNVALTGLSASKYYRVVVETNNGSDSRLYQIRLEAPAATPVCPETLTISSKDSKTAFTEGDAIELTAALAKGNGDISYQWYKGGTAESNKLTGKTTNKLQIASCTTSDAGDYFCVASKTSCPDAVNASGFAITVEADTKCFNMPTITSQPSDLAHITVTGGTLADVGVGKTLKMQSTGIGFGNGNAARLKVTLTGASIVAGTKITIDYNNANSDGSGIGLYNGDYDHQVIATTGVKGDGTVSHTFTAEEAAYYADEFLIDRNNTGKGIIVGSIIVEDCGPAVTKHTITLNYNDGATPAGSLKVVDGNAAVKPADPTRGKYTFLGWFVGDTDTEYVWSTAVTDDITLKAHWQDPWTLTFDADGGSAVADVTVKHNTKAEKPTDPTKDDNDFLGWFYGDPAVEFDWDANVTQDYALVAHWQPAVAKYDVEYYDGETKIGTEEQVWATAHPTAAGIETSKPLYTFVGWYLTSALEGDPVNLNTVTPVEGLKFYGKWNKAYATSYDMEAYAVSDGATLETLLSNLDAAGYAYTNVNDIDNGHTHNYIYDGMKYKTNDGDLSFNVNAGKLVIVKTGNLPANALTMYINGVADPTVFVGANEAVETHVNNYFYSEAEALYRLDIQASKGTCAIKAVTITDPYEVSYDADGGDPVAAQYGEPSVTLPLPVKGTESFLGWFDGETKVGEAGEKYTPTANITLKAHWEAISTDARLASISFSSDAGTLSPAFDPEVVNYTYTMPYKTAAVPTITGATSVNANAKDPVIDAQAANWNDVAHIHGVAESDDTKDYYITMKIAPKDPTCLIWADIPSANTLTFNASKSLWNEEDVTLAINGVSGKDGSAPSGVKFQKPGYIKIQKNEGSFQIGDIVALDVTYLSGSTMHVFKVQEPSTAADVIGTGTTATTPAGVNKVTITEDAATLWLARPDNSSAYKDWNPHVDYVAVYRAMNPVLKSITFAGVDATVNEGAKTVTVTVPNATDLGTMAVVPTIYRNAPHATTPEAVTTNGGEWAEGSGNTYRIMDKDGDYTDYTVTITRAAVSHDATLSALTVDGNAIALEDGVYTYAYEYETGTAVSPAPVVAATAHDANAKSVEITQASDKKGTATVVVTAEDNSTTQTYTINFSISTKIKVVIFNGNDAKATAIKESPDATGASWVVTGLSADDDDKGTSYASKVATGGTTSASKNIAVTIPANYQPFFELAQASNKNGTERKAFITTTANGSGTKLYELANSVTNTPTKGMSTGLSEETTYYIHSDASINFYEVILYLEPLAPKAATPTLSGLADLAACTIGTDELTVTASDLDGGTAHYQWYKVVEGDDPDEAVGTDANTYAPAVAGNYYVVVTNQKDGCRDNSKKSDEVAVSVKTHTEITVAPLNQRATVGNKATLSVTAIGDGILHYTWYTCDDEAGTNPVAVDPANDDDTYEVTVTAAMNQWYKVTVHSDCGEDQSATAKVSEFVPATPANVTESIVWDWESSAWPASGEVQFTHKTGDGTDLTPAYELLADADAIVPNNAAFRSDMLYGKGQWVWRSGNKFFQGTAIKFTTEVAGLVRVNYRSTGNNKEVQVTIAGTPAGKNKTSNFQWSEYVEVPAGDVEILCLSTDANKSLTRVQKIEFYAYDTERADSWIAPGELGTICYPNGHIITGAEVYEMAGVDENNKFVFDQVEKTEPGKPYLFVATSYDPIKLYKTTAAAEVSPIANNGMIGTFVSIDLDYTDERAAKWYYFSGKKFYAVSKRANDLNVPANRAYVDLNESHPAGAPKHGVRRITFDVQGANVATGVENAAATDKPAKMLINGQLFILRGEKMYDAKGQLVK